MDKNWWPDNRALQIGYFILLILIVATILSILFGVDWALDWNLMSTATRDNFLVKELQIGPFMRAIEGQQYILKELFTVSKLSINPTTTIIWLGLIWVGFTGFIAIASFWKRYIFLLVAGLIVLFVNQLYLDEISLFGPGSWKWASILLMAVLVGPAYYFHAFRENSHLAIRWATIFLISALTLTVFHLNQPQFYLHLAGYGVFGFGILAMFFLFLISEEIVFMMLYLITRSKGGTHNEKHFTVFTLAYIIYLGLYWADRMSLIQGDWDILNPFYLLVISTVIAMLTISYKQQLMTTFSFKNFDIRWLLIVLALSTYGLIGLGASRTNDAIMDGLEYLILYMHIGFGFMFLLYIIFNFVNPLIQGLMVYKIAYKEQNFPYASARLGGFVIFLALYFYGEQMPLRRLQGAKLNFEGDYHIVTNPGLAREYYEEAAVFAWDNHYASWRLFEFARDEKEAIYRLNRATTRNPSPYTFVALANVLHESGETTRAIAALRAGQLLFPRDGELLNNLAYYLHEIGAYTEALDALNRSAGTESWNQAVEVNRLAFGDTSTLSQDTWSLALTTNYLAIKNDQLVRPNLIFNTSSLGSDPDLHDITYLINSGWALNRDIIDSTFRKLDQKITNAELSKNLKHANAYNLLESNNINRALRLWGELIESVHSYEKAFFYNQLGDLYLQFYAPHQALEAYEEALYYGSNDALIGKAIALMELTEWEDAKSAWMQAIAVDESYRSIPDELKILSGPTDDPSFAWLYYNLPTSASVYQRAIGGMSNSQINALWSKLFSHLNAKNDEEQLKSLAELFLPYLNPSSQNAYQQYLTAMSDPNSLELSDVSKNAFDTWKILIAAKNEQIAIEDRYNLLVEAIEINTHHPLLIETYAFLSVDMGLAEYGEQALLRLLDLVSPEEYNRIERELYDYKQSRSSTFNDWSE